MSRHRLLNPIGFRFLRKAKYQMIIDMLHFKTRALRTQNNGKFSLYDIPQENAFQFE